MAYPKPTFCYQEVTPCNPFVSHPYSTNMLPATNRPIWPKSAGSPDRPLRQELNSKLLELETLWEQENPDPEKVKALSKRISELRSNLDQKPDDFLTQCRQKFGDRGWSCPGGGWRSYYGEIRPWKISTSVSMAATTGCNGSGKRASGMSPKALRPRGPVIKMGFSPLEIISLKGLVK